VENQLFIGGYITQHYSSLEGVETIQVELRRGVYLDQKELDIELVPHMAVSVFWKTKERLKEAIEEFIYAL